MFPRIIYLLTVLNCTSLLSLYALDEVKQIEVTPELRFRAKTFTRESAPIINPIPWVQFRERVPEGNWVNKGDVVFRLDIQGVLDGVERLENRLEEEKNKNAERLAQLRKSVSELEDKRDIKLDEKAIQVARLTYLKSLPVEADVKIAKGRLNVAQQKLDADEEELQKSRERLEKSLISPAMLNEDLRIVKEQRARTRYAEKMLQLAQLPAHPMQLEIVEYRIRNLELEIEKMNAEIPIQKKIVEIETATRERQLEELQSQLLERQNQVDSEYLFAPADGVLIYSTRLKRELITGGKASEGMVLAEIPRRESMALEGVIPEQLRHLYKVGDPAQINLNIYPNRSFEGKIISIAPFSRDAVEGDTSSGVKIVDVVVEMNEVPENLPIGVFGWVTLSTGKPISGWAVPASWIRYRGGKAHVSVDGEMKPVNGVLHEDRFLLSSPHPPVEKIQKEGRWPVIEDQGIQLSTDQFIATGELTPLKSFILDTPRIRAWDIKITWLVEENSKVNEGDPLIRLDSQQLRDELDKREIDLKRYQGERESTEEELIIRQSEQEFQLGSAENRIEIKKRERDLVYNSRSSSEIFQNQLNSAQAELALEKAEAEWERSVRNAEWTAASERKKLERDLQRRKLELERAKIRTEQSLEGADDLERSTADLDLLKEQTRTAELTAQHHSALSRAQSSLRWRRNREENAEERLKNIKDQIDSLEITAPVSGLVKYLKIWDGVGRSKIKPGTSVWRGAPLLSLSTADTLFVEVPVPERYLQHLEMDMKVSVRIPSEGGMQWNGHIVHMKGILEPANQVVESQSIYGNLEAPREQVINVRVLIETGDETTLKPGAVAQIIFPFEK